ncbi:MAG: primosomal protein N' [Holosporaceae bacterium]|jgi:primosomal protein N' (replication factor Y)|nr:primosomal protein N' [Holosporaceae bacterium]
MSQFSVLPVGSFDNSFLYSFDRELERGEIVEIPLGRLNLIGIITDEQLFFEKKLKIISKDSGFNIGKINCDFLEWVANYTLIPRGNVLKMFLSEKTVFSSKKSACRSSGTVSSASDIELNESQACAYKKILQNGAKPFLLRGVTGSGKTEVYLSALKNVIEEEKQALILFPEIALTVQISERIKKYFGFEPIIWNSNATPRNRKLAWLKAISGESCIIIGTRSALFLPFQNLGIIVVDEEHDHSYKQEEGGFYNARDMAIVRGHLQKIPVILSSATPSLESYLNARSGKYGYISIEKRFGVSQMPQIKLIDMRQNKLDGFVSPYLLTEIKKTVSKGEQCLIYINRRGYSPITLCKSCGEKISCPNCSILLVYHKSIDRLVCHYCNHKIEIPSKCLNCGEENSYIQFGPGIERIYSELKSKLPESTRIEMASSDTISNNTSQLFSNILNNDVDIIIGTQILAKGHHFPNITLVGIIDGDLGLNGPDPRSSEKAYQLINQVAGRAGRAEKPGIIFIQTFNPNHSLYKALQSNNPDEFIELEAELRKKNGTPPYARFASIIISGTNKKLTEKVAKDMWKNRPTNVEVFGPAPSPIFLLRGRSRWRFLLKTSKKKILNCVIKRWIIFQKPPKNIRIQIDIDPISFL